MFMLKNKNVVRTVSLIVACMFLLGIGGIFMVQSGGSKTVSAGPSTSIGFVDFGFLINQHPDMEKARQTFQGEVEQAKKDFEAKAATLSDKEKQDYDQQLRQRLAAKQKELYDAIEAKVNQAIQEVAKAQGLTVVLDKSQVLYGGNDITQDVGKKFSK